MRAQISPLLRRLKTLGPLLLDLIPRLKGVRAESLAVQARCNSLHNEMALVSVLPDEIFAMIFEAAKCAKEGFEITISHVTQHWRNVALGTPRLWTVIRYTSRRHGRFAAYLERSKAVPVYLFLENYMGNTSQICRLIDIHIGRCCELRVTSHSDPNAVETLLRCLSSQHAPHLKYFSLAFTTGIPKLVLPQQIFVGGALSLTSVSLDRMSPLICLLPPTSLTALHLDCYHLSSHKDACRLRDMFATITSLRHLELDLLRAQLIWPSDVLIPLSSLHALQIKGHKLQISRLLTAVHAPSLHVLQLEGSYHSSSHFDHPSVVSWPTKFPALHTLKYGDFLSPSNPGYGGNQMREAARGFPRVAILTCTSRPRDLFSSLQETQDPIWPHLHTLRLSSSDKNTTAAQILELLTKRIDMGHPIRKVLLHQKFSAEDLQELRRLAQIEMYVDDWPKLFEVSIIW